MAPIDGSSLRPPAYEEPSDKRLSLQRGSATRRGGPASGPAQKQRKPAATKGNDLRLSDTHNVGFYRLSSRLHAVGRGNSGCAYSRWTR